MISIIICSIEDSRLTKVIQNIEATIGVKHEVISYRNNDLRSLSSVYNELTFKAKYSFILYLHEDVSFHSKEWGSELIKVLEDRSIGLVGISGTVFKSAVPSSWVSCDKELYRINSIQQYNNFEKLNMHNNPNQESFSEVALIDGVFMATRTDVFESHQFDEVLLDGFHAYDFDYSMAVGIEYKIVVSNEILLEHYSSGTFDQSWFNYTNAVHKKWKNHLPRVVGQVSKSETRHSNYIATSAYLNNMMKFSCRKHIVLFNFLKMFIKYFRYNGFKYAKTVPKYLFTS